MNPRELGQLFERMEKGTGFQRFYGGMYEALCLCYWRIMDEKAPSAVLHSLDEESEGLRKCEEELKMRKKRVEWLTKLSSDWEYEERTKWKGEVPALPAPKVRSGVKRKKNPRPGKLKRMKMRSLRESAAGSTAEEPVGVSLSQPSPGSSGARKGFGESVSRPQEEDGYEEVVMMDEEVEVFLDDDGELDEKLSSPRRVSAALRFSRRVLERPLTYDELIEGVAFPDEIDLELEVPGEDRMF